MNLGAAILLLAGLAPFTIAQSEPSDRAQTEISGKLVQQYLRVTANLESNKKVVLEFLRAQNDPQARAKLLSDEFVEHNPRYRAVEDMVQAYGNEGWLKATQQTNGGKGLVDPDFTPSSGSPVVAVIAEGDLVTVVLRTALRDPDDSSKTYEAFTFEMFVVIDGKIAHHWDGVKLAKNWAADLPRPVSK